MRDEPKVITSHHVFSIKQHFNQLVTPPAIQCVEKLDDHVEHVLDGVAFEHEDSDQVEVREITIVVNVHA